MCRVNGDFFRSRSTPTSAIHFTTAGTSDSVVIAGFVHVTNRCCLSNALDRPSNQFFPSVCVFVNRSVVERLRPQFFTDFHEISHAAQ